MSYEDLKRAVPTASGGLRFLASEKEAEEAREQLRGQKEYEGVLADIERFSRQTSFMDKAAAHVLPTSMSSTGAQAASLKKRAVFAAAESYGIHLTGLSNSEQEAFTDMVGDPTGLSSDVLAARLKTARDAIGAKKLSALRE